MFSNKNKSTFEVQDILYTVMYAQIQDNFKLFIIKDTINDKIIECKLIKVIGKNGIYYKIERAAKIFVGGIKEKNGNVVGRVNYNGIELVFEATNITSIVLKTPIYRKRKNYKLSK